MLVAAVLSACSVEQHHAEANGTDINAVATAAQGDIDTYAGNRPAASPTTAPQALLGAQPTPAPAATDSAAAAGAVVRDYYALIAARRFADAYRLWEDGGQASGLTARAFADGFADYASYRADVGQPGRIDAGAGQRFVEVPVRIAAWRADGPVALAGTLTLHRVADIDGATPEQRQWRISDAAIRPRAVAATPAGAAVEPITASYACAGETRLSVRFDPVADTATFDRDGRAPVVMTGQRPASGIWYKGGGYELRGKGREAAFTAPGAGPVACTAG